MKNLIIVLSVFLAVSTVASAQTATKKEDKCEIKMIKTNEQKHNSAVKGSQASSEIVTKYVCSMDGAVSDKAGNCPKCGMAMTKQETQKTMYACPMHPNEMSANEGECSKCGMKLVKTVVEYNSAVKGSQSSSKVVTKYVCSMDGTTSDKPGKCSKCGMEMTKQETQKTMYACPMHPNEMSANEGECSKCGMKLVKTVVEYNSAVKGSQSSSKVVTKYVCSMDGTTSDKPGKCSKCGMEMTEMKDK